MKILIIGSMKFHKEYEDIKKQLEKNNHQVIIPLPDEFYNKEKNIKLEDIKSFKAIPGHGVEGTYKYKKLMPVELSQYLRSRKDYAEKCII